MDKSEDQAGMTDHSSAPDECYPLSIVPGLSRLYLDYAAADHALSPFYSASPCGDRWGAAAAAPAVPHQSALADLLSAQNHAAHSGPAALSNIEKLRTGARAIVTGQQVSLFGGPLYTLHKAATAIRLAQQASASTGIPHVPIFWLATEDHDFAEADHVILPGRHTLQTIRLTHEHAAGHSPVGSLKLGPTVEQALEQASELLGGSAEFTLLARCYRPEATFASAFAQWLSATFREQGLIVLDASGRTCHALAGEVLRAAILRSEELEQALLARGQELAARGYHAQVLVSPGSSLLFLIEPSERTGEGPHTRTALKRQSKDAWTTSRATYSTADLLSILDQSPERLSPNALLRPVFQDALLPTAAYVGGPAEIAYFAQTAVLYERLLGRVTPVLPRLSATLIDPPTAALLRHFELSLPDVFAAQPTELAQRMGARAMPIEGKRTLALAGNALDKELEAVTAWMHTLDENLGRSATIAASKMRYQMNRLRRLAANYQLQQDAGIARKIAALYHALYPGQHLQERTVGAASAMARYGDRLPAMLVDAAAQPCPGHKALYL
jgi:bacillithiol biosynthesis cysteine-adding enzyme BshC